MTNESMIKLCQTADVGVANWIIPKKVAVVDIYTYESAGIAESSPCKDVCILFNGKERVGIVMPMGVDFHMVTLPEHRDKGYMAEFMRSGVINKLMPELTAVSTHYDENTDEYRQIRHLASLAGLHTLYVPDGDQSKFRNSVYRTKSTNDSFRATGINGLREFDTNPLTDSEETALKATRDALLKKFEHYNLADNIRCKPKALKDIDDFLDKIYDLMYSYGIHFDIGSFIIENGIKKCDEEDIKELLDKAINERFVAYDGIGENDYNYRVEGEWWGSE